MFRFSDQVWKEMQMGEVVTLLTSAAGHALVKSFRGPDLTKQNFSIGNSFQVVEEQVSDLKSLSNVLHKTALPVDQKDHLPKRSYQCRSCTIGGMWQ